ncbi:MAG: hypothetical protein WC510_03100 [Candidatus Omnitrophota bacterium]
MCAKRHACRQAMARFLDGVNQKYFSLRKLLCERQELPMKECKCCKTLIKEKAAFCPSCGYDPKTDTMSASFRQNAVSREERNRKMLTKERRCSHGIRPGVKISVFIGLAVVIFVILYKHNFNPNRVMSEIKQAWDKARVKTGKIIPMEVEKKKGPGKEAETFNPSTALIVQGVVWGEPMPQAIINNRVINMGDVIEGAKVIDISKKGVVLLYKDRKYLLPSYVSKYKE